MTTLIRRLPMVLVLLAGHALVPGARAAESFDNCKGFIDSIPATIATQGVWCLRQDLSSAIASGAAITIATNNVTIDCNDFKLGGLAAGDASTATGIHADDRQNATVRHCNVRGFRIGIDLADSNGGGHLVEDNRLDNNLLMGIQVQGENNLVQRNRVYDTGGAVGAVYAVGIRAHADVDGNTVAGVFSSAADGSPIGIEVLGEGNVARDNRVRGLQVSGTGYAYGISAGSTGITVDGNQVTASVPTDGTGIAIDSALGICSNNVVVEFGTAISGCVDNGGNATQP